MPVSSHTFKIVAHQQPNGSIETVTFVFLNQLGWPANTAAADPVIEKQFQSIGHAGDRASGEASETGSS